MASHFDEDDTYFHLQTPTAPLLTASTTPAAATYPDSYILPNTPEAHALESHLAQAVGYTPPATPFTSPASSYAPLQSTAYESLQRARRAADDRRRARTPSSTDADKRASYAKLRPDDALTSSQASALWKGGHSCSGEAGSVAVDYSANLLPRQRANTEPPTHPIAVPTRNDPPPHNRPRRPPSPAAPPQGYPSPLPPNRGLPSPVRKGAYVRHRVRKLVISHGETLLPTGAVVRDARGSTTPLFTVTSRILSAHARRTLCDGVTGLPLLTLVSSKIAGSSEMLIEDAFAAPAADPMLTLTRVSLGVGRGKGVKCCTAKQMRAPEGDRNSIRKPQPPPPALFVTPKAGHCTLRITDPKANHVADVVRNTSGLKAIASARSTYFVNVSAGYDSALLAAISICVNEMFP